jgi:hypothetical protein
MSTSYQSNSIAWLIPIPHCTLDAALKSNLASVRLRVAISAEKFIDKGYKVDFCDGEKNIIPEILFIGKFNHSTDEARFNRWSNYINLCKENGTKIIIDYTDNHAYADNVMGDFYKKSLHLSDMIICSSNKLAGYIQALRYKNHQIIEDPIEYRFIKPIKKENKMKRALWFGHASNLGYFLDFILKLKKYTLPIEFIALTNVYPMDEEVIRKLNSILPENVNVNFVKWSHQNMIDGASISDFCIIPTGINDSKKNGASSNRLLTALTLGLPVLADPLDSYLEFEKYFTKLNLENFANFNDGNIEYNFNNIRLAQSLIMAKYTREAIANKWNDSIILKNNC